jgi:hypothetical protein
MSLAAPTLEAFFTERLMRQKNASPHTIASYRDCLKLLLAYAWQVTGTAPSGLDFADLDATVIAGFLDHLERDRGLSPRSRNVRLAAIRSLFSFAALRHPEHAALIGWVLAIPPNGATGRSSASSVPPRPTPCSPARTTHAAWGGVTTHCSSWHCRPGCAPASSPRCASTTSTSAPEPLCTAPERGEKTAPPRSPRQPSRS